MSQRITWRGRWLIHLLTSCQKYSLWCEHHKRKINKSNEPNFCLACVFKMHIKTPTQSLPWWVVSMTTDWLHATGLALDQLPSGSKLGTGMLYTNLQRLQSSTEWSPGLAGGASEATAALGGVTQAD